MQDGKLLPGRHFTEEVRHNPKIMLEWIAHDLLGIIKRLGNVKTPNGFFGTMGSLGFFENVLDVQE